MSESTEQLRRLQILQMADLGTARREMISTADIKKARIQLDGIELQRQVDQRDKSQLAKWANLHAEIGDTSGMEGLEDIASGQSHRANLHAMLHPDESQSRVYANHLFPTPSAGRGGGFVGTRGRAGFVPPSTGHVHIPSGPRSASKSGRGYPSVSRLGHPGIRDRSATVPSGFGLDPALNRNNADNDPQDWVRSRGRGRGRSRARGRGKAPEPAHKQPAPSLPSRAQRPVPAFTAKISDPADFMSSFQSRRASEMPKAPSEKAATATIQNIGNVQQPILPNRSKTNVLLDADKRKTAKSILSTAHPESSPLQTPTPSPRVVPLDKTALFKGKRAQSSRTKPSPSHIGPYQVETPTKLPSPAPAAKGTTSGHSWNQRTLFIPDNPEAFGVPVNKLSWKVSPEEEPRRLGKHSPSKKSGPAKPSTPRNEVQRTAAVKTPHTKDNKQVISSDSHKARSKQTTQPKTLLDMDDIIDLGVSPVGAPLATPSPPKAKAIPSPGAAELEGLMFIEKTESRPVQSIDEIISPKLGEPQSPGPQSDRKQQDQRRIIAHYVSKTMEGLRHLSEDISGPNLSARDIEPIVETTILQSGDRVSERELQQLMMTAAFQHVLKSKQATDILGSSSAVRRDVTPFERHRSPAPPHSNSTSPPSAEKRRTKARVPGLSPTRSEDSDIITRFEALQVSDKLAPPLQPQRATPERSPGALGVSKRSTASNTSKPRSLVAPIKRVLSINDSIYADPVSSVSSSQMTVSPKMNIIGPHLAQTQVPTQMLSTSPPNISKVQHEKPSGVRTIGPAPYRPPTLWVNTSENRYSDIVDLIPKSAQVAQSSKPVSQQTSGRVFSMPDPATLPQPQAKTVGPAPFQRRK